MVDRLNQWVTWIQRLHMFTILAAVRANHHAVLCYTFDANNVAFCCYFDMLGDPVDGLVAHKLNASANIQTTIHAIGLIAVKKCLLESESGLAIHISVQEHPNSFRLKQICDRGDRAMFLFLSKLLPLLLLYPLGLSCLLLLLALLLLWRRPRLAWLPILLVLVLLGVSSSAWASEGLVRSLEFQYLPRELPKADAIVVLGGASQPAFPPRQMPEVMEEGDRILYGAKLYREGKAPKVILSGGRIDWQGGGTPEAVDMANLMEPMGVPKTAVILEPSSYNTYENAINVKAIMEAQGIRTILLVTSAMHMPRAIAIFKRLGIETIPAPTDYLTTDPNYRAVPKSSQEQVLRLLPDVERLRLTTRALKEYVGTAIYRVRGWV
jgi:uncharacterized SAM-binding protein YcdF (DUF218 family)